VGMGHIDRLGNHHNSVGAPGAGRFTEKFNARPAGGLTDISIAPIDSPDVRSPDFTIESLRAAVGTEELLNFEPDAEGRARVGWSTDSYGDSLTSRATIDDAGELVRLEVDWRGNDEWHDADPDGRELHDLRHKINVDRLAFGGIYVHGIDNDGGAYGNRFVGGRAHEDIYDAAKISKRIREDLKKAQAVGAIPSNLVYRVNTDKFAGGQSITVTVEGIRDGQLSVDRGDGFQGRHPWAVELDRTIQVIGDQWQDSEVETQTDYFNVRYYFSVSMPDERMQQWALEERERAARKRAARPGAA
jgi:hypothetical protein